MRCEIFFYVENLAGTAAYNLGLGGVHTWERMDVRSPGNDYSSDVIARAQHLVRRFKWTCSTDSGATTPGKRTHPSQDKSIYCQPVSKKFI